jgi:hypothetical protein
MANEHFAHIVLRNISETEKFSRPGTGGKRRSPSQVRDREAHAVGLLQQLNASEEAARGAVALRSGLLTQAENGIYLAFEGRYDEPLLTERFERRSKGIELLSVREEAGRTTATVFVPESAREVFPKLIEDYRTKDEPRAKEPEPKNRRLVDGIAEIRLAALRDLWIDIPDRFPATGEIADWEVWLRPSATERFRQAAREVGAVVGSSSLVFPEEVALFAQTSPEILAQLNESTLGLARVARARKTAAFFLSTKPADQMRQMQEFLSRVHLQENPRTSLCILDTGVNRAHLLLAPLIAAEDCHSYLDDWSTDDHHGHGTAMSGVCGYGDLAVAMNGQDHMSVPYALESVKIIPPVGRNPYELYGAVTAGAVAKAELAKPHRKRVFCLATTTDEDTPHFGRPTSWSAEVDQLSFGSVVTQREARLLCISAGNIREPQLRRVDYPEFNDLQELESPAHAWNGLAVGAYTAMTRITDPTRAGWTPFSAAGDLGPVSRTAAWNDTWPIKPDIVMEGGNLGVDPADGLGYGIDELRLLTTSKDYPQTPFEAFSDTSAATANAARLCAIVQSQYPDLWPETIRSLVIDSAEWTDAMLNHLPVNPKKSDHAVLLKRYGYGVPDLDRALYSASNSLTLVVEDTIQPYLRNDKKRAALNEMKLFKLPWPLQALTSLGNTQVRMRVTLSYFIEPNPAESARNKKLRYASHGLRFAVKLPDEEFDAFRKRVNKAAREDEGVEHHESDSFWVLGANLRDRGAVHSDIWRGPSSDLARRGFIAVYPVSGWWKDREHLERYNRTARFSLVVSIVTPPTEVDIYTPITNLITIKT